MTLMLVPPGQPTVDRHGPLFPALETNMTLCFCTASVMTSQILLKHMLRKYIKHVKTEQKTETSCEPYPELGQWVASP